MDFLYFSSASTNGYDSLGHYLRAVFVADLLHDVRDRADPELRGQLRQAGRHGGFRAGGEGLRRVPTVADAPADRHAQPDLARQDAVAAGLDPSAFDAEADGSTRRARARRPRSAHADSLPASVFPGQPAASRTPAAASTGSSATPATAPRRASSAAPAGGAGRRRPPAAVGDALGRRALLDYLLGG